MNRLLICLVGFILAHTEHGNCQNDFPFPGNGTNFDTPILRTDRHWNGFNPFLSPASTTDYYGSGDCDLDGRITTNDLALMQQIIQGSRPPTVRADVDASGLIDGNDVVLLQSALNGEKLPGWWSLLETSSERTNWISRVASLDFSQMIANSEAEQGWVCTHYTRRTFLRFSPQVEDPGFERNLSYGIVQSTYNLPVYEATVTGTNFGHALNAILIGDDPVFFTNWFILEPQEGIRRQPGDWDLPWNAELRIILPAKLNEEFSASRTLIEFQIQPSGTTASYVSTNLITTKVIPNSVPIHNDPNVWQPFIIPNGNGLAVFNKKLDGLADVTQPHILTNLETDANLALPLFRSKNFSRLIDISTATEGRYHLLWLCHTNRHQELFYGELETASYIIDNQKILATNVVQAKVLGKNTDVFVFYPNETGLVCLHKTNGQWQQPEIASQWTEFGFKLGSPQYSATLDSNGIPCVIWSDETDEMQSTIFVSSRSNSWNSTVLAEIDGFVPTIDCTTDRSGAVHVIHSETWFPRLYTETSTPLWQIVRGKIVYRKWDQGIWNSCIVSSNSFWPKISVTSNENVIALWQTDMGANVVPVWKDLTLGSTARAVSTTGIPYYPSIVQVSSGELLLYWTDISQSGSQLRYKSIRSSEGSNLDIIKNDGSITLTWQAENNGPFQIQYSDSLTPVVWQPVSGASISGPSIGSITLQTGSNPATRFYRIKKT